MSDKAGISRRGKTAFALLAALGAVAILAFKGYQVFVEPEQMTRQYLGIEAAAGPAPQFAFEARDGKSVGLSDYRGRFVLLNYWATWCDSCRMEMPGMAVLAQQLKGEPFAMVAASVDDGWEPVDEYFSSRAPPFEVLRDPDAKWSKAYGTVKFPETYLIGPDGQLRAKFVGPRDWNDRAFELYLRKALAELPHPSASASR